MTKVRYKTNSAVFALIFDDSRTKILLQKRINTNIKDGYFDVGTSGHVEKNESMSQAMIRELKEELGINVEKKNLKFSSMMHKKYNDTAEPYYNGYFIVEKYEGTPHIVEPEKDAELLWAPIKDLPQNLIEDRKIAINNYLNGISYCEDGWD
ncbi:NUDIX domain-containing protein [Fructilactobacillus cliffordii]|uniref:NUDIX domain-containing protein n=1 Tax=Fructilactobacillus cliffordii TaxID=2940299 RepID=A0A9Q8ZUW7_9LACO|nr:NUDIX domain-containing protein [Fructilactobacillus cliffordii]USS88961.1 NUDIX domain-containing protein [Fructilactobacillus cliffordii]